MYSFLLSHSGAQKSIDDAVHLSLNTTVDLSLLNTPDGCTNAAKNPETVMLLEQLVLTWCQQIENVLAQGQQMRRESDDSGTSE